MIDTTVAINTIVVYTLSLAVSLLAFGIFGFRSFPVFGSYGHRQGQGTAQSHLSGPAAASRGVGLLRVRVLFAGSMLMVIDSINNLVMHVQVWRTGEANFVVYQLLRVFFVPAGTMFVIAMAHRIAIIAVMRPRWKRGFLWTACGFAVYIAFQQCTLLVISVLGKLNLTSDEWLNAVVFPEWSAYTIIFLPVFCISGSIWSLRIAFGSSSKSSAKSSDMDSRGGGGWSGGSSLVQNTTGHSVMVDLPIRYSLTWVFKVLVPPRSDGLPQTLLIMIYWTAFLLILGNQHPNIPIRVGSLSSLITSLCILTEGSFEWLLKRECRRHRIHQRLASRDDGIQLAPVCNAGSHTREEALSPTPPLISTLKLGSPRPHQHTQMHLAGSSSTSDGLADVA